jgi:hypothetical protein
MARLRDRPMTFDAGSDSRSVSARKLVFVVVRLLMNQSRPATGVAEKTPILWPSAPSHPSLTLDALRLNYSVSARSFWLGLWSWKGRARFLVDVARKRP